MSNLHWGSDMTSDQHSVAAEERLDSSRDRQVSFRIPLALDQRLDALVDRALDAGERTNRRELLAAILFTAGQDGDELGALLKRYRRATVREAMLDQDTGNLIEFRRRAPGPRPRANA